MRFYLFVSSNMIWSSENGALCPNSGKIANYHMDAAPYFSPSGSFWAWTNAGPPYWTNCRETAAPFRQDEMRELRQL